MPISETVTLQHVIDLLNEATRADPAALRYLTETRTVCDEKLAEHPTIQVAAFEGAKISGEGDEKITLYSVGLLGILNGIFGTDEGGWGAISAEFDVDCLNGCKRKEKDKSVVGDPCPVCGKDLVLGKLTGFVDNGRR